MTHPFAKFVRLVWIDAQLEVGGVNRADLVAAFGISSQQASNDLGAYRDEYPSHIEYNVRGRFYQRPRRSKAAYPQHLRLQIVHAVRAVRLYRGFIKGAGA